MDDNTLNETPISSNRKFIFADSFYDGLAETNIDNSEVSLSENNISAPIQVSNEDSTENLNDFNDNKVDNNINNNFDNNEYYPSNMDMTNNFNVVQQESTLDNNELAPEPNTNDIDNQKIETESVEEINNDVIPMDVQTNIEPDEKKDFTNFLLGNNVNYQISNDPIESPKLDVTDDNPNNIKLDDSLNVETGIDTGLESFLFNKKEVPVVEEDEFAAYRKNIESDVKKVYRAARRKREKPASRLLTEEYKKDFNDLDDKYYTEEAPVIPVYGQKIVEEEPGEEWKPDFTPQPVVIKEEVDYTESIDDENTEVIKSDLLDQLREKSKETGKISILAKYGDDFCSRDYVTNPAIGREREIKELGLILLTPEKSAILVGKPGIGKTSIVEGLAYRIQRNKVPDALKGYRIISVKTTSLLGTLPSGETRLQTMIDEIKDLDKIILFVDEIHMLMGATNESSLDFANMFKESLGRGSIKMIGATTSDEYERYVLRDKAFVRRFQRVDVNEPTRDETVEILMGTLPKIEKTTGAKLKYTHFIKTEIMGFIVDITTEYKRVYGIGSRYPDICITLLNQAFSEAVFDNRTEVNIFDIRSAIEHSKNIYPDVIRKELVNFDQKFKNVIQDERNDQ